MPGSNISPIGKALYYSKITGLSKIGRRYFVMNSFDGALMIIGVLLGSFFGGVFDPSVVLSVGIGAAVAVGISGLWGAYFTERAERKKELKELEAALHRKLDKTELKEAYDFTVVAVALVDSLSPLITSLIILLPFLLFQHSGPDSYAVQAAYFSSFTIAALIMFGLGAYLGKLSGEGIIVNGLKMLTAGAICLLVLYLLKML